MNALLLPGNSPRHQAWIEELRTAVMPRFQQTLTLHYRHWQSGEPEADVDYELGVAEALADNLDQFVIIAKSIGTAIASDGVSKGALKPKKLILLGLPISSSYASERYKDWFDNIAIDILIAQNTNDPLGSFADVKQAFEKLQNVSLVELPGNTHDYLDFEAIKKLI